MKIKDIELITRERGESRAKLRVGDEFWIKAKIKSIDRDGYVRFEGDSPLNGFLFGRGNYEDVEIKIED